jgi:HlyD family secretion protein
MRDQEAGKGQRVVRWLVASLLALTLTACGTRSVAQPTPTPATGVDSGGQPVPASISSNGVLVPFRRMELSFGVAGFVESVAVETGQSVQVGQALAALDSAPLERALARAELDLRRAQLRLGQLQEPVDEADVRQAEHAVSQAAAALELAQANLDAVLNSVLFTEALADAQRAFDEAQARYLGRQAEYERGEIAYWFVDQTRREYEEARLDLVRLQQQAELQEEGARNEVDRARQAVQEAQDGLQRLLAGTEPYEVEAAQLDVEAAQLALEAARADVARATLSAPFDGVVAAVGVSAGEWAAPGTVVVELLDLSRWRVETRNVGELEIARVELGQEVTVRVNAFRQEALSGRVVSISPVAVVQQGDTTYSLLIELEPTELDLRSGMTAQVEVVSF